MAHELFGDRFAGYRTLGWPQLGTTFDDPQMDAVSAGIQADLFFRITKQSMLVQMEDKSLLRTDKHMLVREATKDDPSPRPLGVVSDSYSYLQNREVAELIDKYFGGAYPVETVGALEQGRTIFYLLRAGEGEVAGDAMIKYLLVTDRRDGGSALKIANVIVRVVCANTLAAALDSSLSTLKISHTLTHVAMVEDRMSILKRVEGGMASTLARLAKLTDLKLTEDQLERVIKAAFPPPKETMKAGLKKSLMDLGVPLTEVNIDFGDSTQVSQVEKMKLFRQAAKLDVDQFNQENPRYANTGWAAYNGIVEFCDFREGGTDSEAQRSALFGYRATEKARAMRELELILAGQ